MDGREHLARPRAHLGQDALADGAVEAHQRRETLHPQGHPERAGRAAGGRARRRRHCREQPRGPAGGRRDRESGRAREDRRRRGEQDDRHVRLRGADRGGCVQGAGAGGQVRLRREIVGKLSFFLCFNDLYPPPPFSGTSWWKSPEPRSWD